MSEVPQKHNSVGVSPWGDLGEPLRRAEESQFGSVVAGLATVLGGLLLTVLVYELVLSREREAVGHIAEADALQLADRLGASMQRRTRQLSTFRRVCTTAGRQTPEQMAANATTFIGSGEGIDLIAGIGDDGGFSWAAGPPEVLGLDPREVAGAAVWDQALERAQSADTSVAVYPAKFLQDVPCLGLLAPLCDNATVSPPQSPLVLMGLNIQPALDESLTDQIERDYDISIADGDRVLLRSRQHTEATSGDMSQTQVVRVADRAWRLLLLPTDAALSQRVVLWHTEVAMAGAVLSLGLGLLAWRATDLRHRRVRQYQHSLELLHKSVAGIGTRLGSGQEVLERLAECARVLLRMDRAAIGMLDESGQVLVVRTMCGDVPPDMPGQLADLPASRRCMETGQMYMEGDAPAKTLINVQVLRVFQSRATVLIPLRVEGRAAGLLGLFNSQPRRFSGADRRLAELLGTQAEMILANNLLFERSCSAMAAHQHLLEQREKVYEVAAAVYHAPSFRESVQAIVDRAPLVLELDSCAVILGTANKPLRILAASGLNSDKIVGRRIDPPDAYVLQATKSGRPVVIEDTTACDPPVDPWFREVRGVGSLVFLPLLGADRQPMGMLVLSRHRPGAFSDEQRRLFELFGERAAAAIENAMLQDQTRTDARAKAVLLHELHHRVKNNLSGIVGLLSMDRPPLPDDARRWIDGAVGRIEALARVHDLYAADAGSVTLGQIVSHMPVSLSVILPANVTFQTEVTDKDTPLSSPKGLGLAIVLYELCTNAVVHGLKGSGQLSIRARRCNGAAQVEVYDDGGGFDPTAPPSSEGGRGGLGLRLVREIVGRELRGTLRIQSAPGSRNAGHSGVRHRGRTRKDRVMSQAPTVAQRALRVLIVEDETLVGMTLQHQLEQLGHSVVGQAADAAEATALFRKHSPDLVLLDIRLRGGGDGLDLAATLREERACPVIVISAFSEPQLIDRAAEVGVFGYLIKPVNERALEAQIEVALKRFSERQALAGEVQQLQQALETRRLLDRAKAILIKRAGLSEDDAHRQLLQESQNRRIPLAKLCRNIIDADQAKRG